MKYLVVVVFCTCVFAHSQEQTFSCPQYTEDILNYFVMAYPARVDQSMGPGNANPIYSSIVPDYGNNTYSATGYFIWTKSLSGYPWDIKTYDSRFVYDRSTELGWTDPTSFKRFTTDLPMTQRCVRVGYPGATLKIPALNTSYRSYKQCVPYLTQPLDYGRKFAFGSHVGKRWQCRADPDPALHLQIQLRFELCQLPVHGGLQPRSGHRII